MKKYDFFIAGRWRNKDKVREILNAVRSSGKTAYCFTENLYVGEKVEFDPEGDINRTMEALESVPQNDDFIKKSSRLICPQNVSQKILF